MPKVGVSLSVFAHSQVVKHPIVNRAYVSISLRTKIETQNTQNQRHVIFTNLHGGLQPTSSHRGREDMCSSRVKFLW